MPKGNALLSLETTMILARVPLAKVPRASGTAVFYLLASDDYECSSSRRILSARV